MDITGRPVSSEPISSLRNRVLRKFSILPEEFDYKLNKTMDNLKLNQEETKKWLKNILIFTSPILAILFAQLALGVEPRQAGLLALYAFYSLLADYFKKLKKK